MGKRRMIDCDALLFDSKLVKALGCNGLWVYVRLWSLAEDSGCVEVNIEDITLQMGALKLKGTEVAKHVEALITQGKLIRYGDKYGWLGNFRKHQTLNNSPIPKLPLPPWVTYEVVEGKRRKAFYVVDESKVPATGSKTKTPTSPAVSKKPPKKPVPEKVKHLDCVLLTDAQYKGLCESFGKDGAEACIKKLNDSIMSKGYVYKSHFHTIHSWVAGELGLKEGVTLQDKPAILPRCEKCKSNPVVRQGETLCTACLREEAVPMPKETREALAGFLGKEM